MNSWSRIILQGPRKHYREWCLLAFFCLCMTPFYIGSLSVNYLFLLLPFWMLLTGRTIKKPPKWLIFCMVFYAGLFLLGVLTNVLEGQQTNLRSLSSFLLFFSMFALVFFEFSQKEFRIFKLAIVINAIVASLTAIFVFYSAGGNEVGFAQKDIVGSQRYGFMYAISFMILILDRELLRLNASIRCLLVGLVVFGVLLTFSRAAVLSVGVAVAICLAVEFFNEVRGGVGVAFARLVNRSFLFVLPIVVALVVMPLPLKFYSGHLFERYVSFVSDFVFESSGSMQRFESGETTSGFSKSDTDEVNENGNSHSEIVADVLNEKGSEGTRVVLLKMIVAHVAQNPILGSQYLGVWSLPNSPSGSSHNQYFDVLLRTGVLGFFDLLWPAIKNNVCVVQKG